MLFGWLVVFLSLCWGGRSLLFCIDVSGRSKDSVNAQYETKWSPNLSSLKKYCTFFKVSCFVDDNFIEEMTDFEYDDYKENFLFNDFYVEVLNRLRVNPRFYDPRIDMFDLHIWPLRSRD